MPAPHRPSEVRRNLRASILDGAGFMVMVGAGETYFPAFALAIGKGDVEAGLVATVPLLVGAALQLVSPWAVVRLASNRRWVVLTSAVQALAFVPLVAVALAGGCPTWTLFALASVYFGAGLASGGAWTTWIETLVPRRAFAPYFGRRTAWLYAAYLAVVLAAGVFLEAARGRDVLLPAFAVLLALAGAGRLFSVRMLLVQTEPEPLPPGMRHLSMRQFAARLAGSPTGRAVALLLFAQFSIQIANPFVSPYLLERRHVSYETFAVLAAIPPAVRIVACPLLGRFAHARGPRALLALGMALMVPGSALWLVPGGVPWCAAVQVVSGAAWAAFEMGQWLVFVDTIPAAERTSVMTTFYLWNAVAMVAGSVVGGVLLASDALGMGGYAAVFALSAVARLAAAGAETRWRPAVVRPGR